MKKQPLIQFYTLDAVAKALGVSEKTVRRRIAAGDLHVHRIGGQLRISVEDYRAFVALRRR
jgi:excisionase family DNA binding protein